jgi:DNA polymerase-1
VGGKTAVTLIQQFGPIEEIYRHINQARPPRLQALLRDGEAVARRSKKLATIVTDVPVVFRSDECAVSHYDHGRVTELFRELGFASLLSRLGEMAAGGREVTPAAARPPPSQHTYRVVTTPESFDEMTGRLAAAGSFSFDLEATGLDPMSAQIVGLSFSHTPGEAYYVPVGHVALEGTGQLPLDLVISRIKPLVEDGRLSKMAHNANYDMTLLAQYGVAVNNLTFDSMIAAHLLSERSLSLKALAFERLGAEMTPITELIGTGARQLNMSQVEIERVAEYAGADADMTLQLSRGLDTDLRREGLWSLFADVEMPLVPVLVHMQLNGVALDTELLGQMSKRLAEQLRRLELEIYNHVGHQFNINSPQQLSAILFQDLKLPGRRKGGSYTTGAEVLEELRGTHPIIAPILEFRQLAKLKSTYIDALPGLVNRKTGRLHTSFNQTRTSTGRLSSTDPNLQNIPVRGDLGREIRLAFVAPNGCLLMSADYSQIDLRALAHLSQDEGMLEAFRHDEDIHSATASRLFGVPPLLVTPDMRRVAKTVNFGVIYGMSEYGLEQATELSREEAARFISAYFEKYAGVKAYLEDTKRLARERGFVETLLGRRRSIPEINSPNRQVRQAAERMAINMPVQGTSADIIKVAMVNLFREMEKRKLKSRMLLQVHDELLFEVPEGEIADMQSLVPRTMSDAIELRIPVRVESKVGRNWGELK